MDQEFPAGLARLELLYIASQVHGGIQFECLG